MATTKMTFTLDAETVARLRRTAERLGKPRSQVVRDAIHDLSERMGRLSERERLGMLEAFDEVISRIPQRPVSEVDRELRSIRKARRQGGWRSRS